MPTTPLQIITAAYGLSSKNRPGTIATEATELLQVVVRAVQELYSLAPRVNYAYFAGFSDVRVSAESGGPEDEGWQPPECECVFRIERTEHTTGGQGVKRDEVKVVPYDDVTAELGSGAVFHLGSTYFPAGNPMDPTGGVLRFFFSRIPDSPATINDALDAQWPEQFNEILIFEVGAYLADKDGRSDEATALRGQKMQALLRFTMHLEHRDANELRRVENVRRFNGTTLVPLASFGLPQAG